MAEAGHCARATAKASCIASSANSKSPTRRIRVANTRPASARNTASMRPLFIGKHALAIPGSILAHRPDRPYFDGAVACTGALRSDCARLIKILGLNQIVATELFAGLGKRAVRGHGLAVADPNGRRGRNRAQALASLEISVLHDALGEGTVFGHGL